MPSEPVLAMLLMNWSVETWVCLPEICAARPRAATSIASVAMNGTSRPYAISIPFTRPAPIPTAIAVKIMPAEPKLCVATVVAPHPGERDQRADGQVDATTDDDEGHADGDHADRGRLVQDDHHVVDDPVRVAVELGPDDRADDEQHQQHPDQGEVAPPRLFRLVLPEARLHAGGRVGRRLCSRLTLDAQPPSLRSSTAAAEPVRSSLVTRPLFSSRRSAIPPSPDQARPLR